MLLFLLYSLRGQGLHYRTVLYRKNRSEIELAVLLPAVVTKPRHVGDLNFDKICKFIMGKGPRVPYRRCMSTPRSVENDENCTGHVNQCINVYHGVSSLCSAVILSLLTQGVGSEG